MGEFYLTEDLTEAQGGKVFGPGHRSGAGELGFDPTPVWCLC